tara:strand:- start:2159 stop:2524 length:366 start_codon:yes stop_codon:yes gene_type:complete
VTLAPPNRFWFHQGRRTYHRTLACSAITDRAGWLMDTPEMVKAKYQQCDLCVEDPIAEPDLHIQPMPTDVTCQRCASNEGRYTRSGPHVKLECSQCGSYVKFVSKITLAPELVGMLFEDEE